MNDELFLSGNFVLVEYSSQTSLFIFLTSPMDPCPQMVIAGKAMSDMGLAVVLRVVIVGSACQTSYAWLTERVFLH